jgi:hypothetical protein
MTASILFSLKIASVSFFLRHIDLIELRPDMGDGFNPIEHRFFAL